MADSKNLTKVQIELLKEVKRLGAFERSAEILRKHQEFATLNRSTLSRWTTQITDGSKTLSHIEKALEILKVVQVKKTLRAGQVYRLLGGLDRIVSSLDDHHVANVLPIIKAVAESDLKEFSLGDMAFLIKTCETLHITLTPILVAEILKSRL